MEIIACVSEAIALAEQLNALPGIAKNAEAKLLLADLQLKLADIQAELTVTQPADRNSSDDT